MIQPFASVVKKNMCEKFAKLLVYVIITVITKN